MDIDLNIAKQFSEFPFGRYPAHGDYNGERFREEKLIPALRRGGVVTVDMTGARGLAASFLEESFGGLVRRGFELAELETRLVLISVTDPSLADEAWGYIRDAAAVGGVH